MDLIIIAEHLIHRSSYNANSISGSSFISWLMLTYARRSDETGVLL